MKYRIQLQGLHCESCKKLVQKRLEKLDGIVFVDVDIDKQLATLESGSVILQQQIEVALNDTEYKVIAFTEI